MASRLEDVILRGTAALRPVATAVAAGTLYFSTDTEVTERSTGTAWESYSAAAGGGGGGSGDVVGPSSATNNALALFDGTTGKLLKDDPAADHLLTGEWTFKASSPSDVPLAITDATGARWLKCSVTGDPYLKVQFADLGAGGRTEWYGRVTIDVAESGLHLGSSSAIHFSSAGPLAGNNDVGLKRLAARIVRVQAGSFETAPNAGGAISLGDTAANSPKPTASATYRGTLWITWGTAGVADVIEVCLKDAADAYAWHPITFT